ncbi:MAG: hypothetical protein EOM19_04860 [Candidatus Moranbacteria bacterium]|nr:hypothetical protein [Candidatus Moranbacteria bacterium]
MKILFHKIWKILILLKRFISKEYKWIIAILIAIPSVIVTFQNIQFEKTSKSFFYVPEFIESEELDFSKNGDCWTGSIASFRRDAFRCSFDNSIVDPCFEDPYNFKSVTCPQYPEEEHPLILKIDAAKVEPKNQGMEDTKYNFPWYVIMYDGSTCRMITGTAIVVADKRFDYFCSNGDTHSLILPLKERDGKLYMDCTRNGRIIEDCLIKEAWF